ncbi:MFS transporter [Sphingopyxis flava]|uniref:Predicted arabinose efflux permease, MFS family n=1 Tax=Sphingopyxis flava TaxID=1507287 RepID=A0A1T5GD18_9SPHN|nr:MFS transporter [Sphingopyxis flava]SKC06353.1 Predicted arabinose efflux permease, MFS family [Sphingopyxis flava]
MTAARFYPGWYAVVLAFLVQFLASGPIYYGFSVFSGVFDREFQASRTAIALILTLVTLFSGFAGIPIGWLLRRVSVRTVMLTGAVGQVAGLTIVSQAADFMTVLIGYGLVAGLADALLSVQLTNILIVHWFERRRGLAMGIAVTSTSFASIVYPPLLMFLIDTIGWRATFLVSAASLAALTPFIAWKARFPGEVPEAERLTPSPAPASPAQTSMKGEAAPARPPERVYRSADFWIVTLAVGAIFSANLAIISAAIPYAVAQGLSAYAAAGLLSLQGGVALLAKVGFGFVADKVRLDFALAAASAIGAASMALWLIGGSAPMLIGAAVCFGVCLGGALPLFGVILARRFGLGDYAMVVGASRTAQAPMMLGMPMLAGLLFDATGTWRPTFLLLLLGLLAIAALSLRARFAGPRS